MRVGIVTSSYPRFEGDFAGVFVAEEASRLAGAGHSVDVIAPEPAAEPTRTGPRGVHVHWTPYLRPRSLAAAFYGAGLRDNARAAPLQLAAAALYPLSAWLRHAADGRRWDRVHAHWAFPLALLGRRLAPRAALRAVFHGGDVSLLEGVPGRGALAAQVARSSDELQFVSEDLQDRFVALLPRAEQRATMARSLVSAMPVRLDDAGSDAAQRRAARAQFGFRAPTVLGLGRLVPVKQLAALVDAAPALTRAGYDVVIAGDGPERAALEARARAREVPVRFLGAVHGDAKWSLLRAADVVVSLSGALDAAETEGTPLVAREAVAVGTPVVTTDAGGLRDSLRHGQRVVFIADTSPEEVLRGVKLACLGTASRSAVSSARGGCQQAP